MKDETRELGLPHVEILQRAHELKQSGKLERLKAAAIRVTAAKIKESKKQS